MVRTKMKMMKTLDLEWEEREEKKNGRWDATPPSVAVESSGYMYAPGMKSLRFVSLAKFSWEGVSLVVSVSDVSLDAAVGVSANSGKRLRKGGALSQSDWLTADRSKSSSGNGPRSNLDISGRLDRLWQVSIKATSRKRGESLGPICKVWNCWRRFSNSWCCAVGRRLLLEPLDESLAVGSSCKDNRTAERTKGVRHTCPGPSKGRGEARYFAP